MHYRTPFRQEHAKTKLSVKIDLFLLQLSKCVRKNLFNIELNSVEGSLYKMKII